MTMTELLYSTVVALAILLAALGLGNWILCLLRIEKRNVETLWLASICGLGGLSVSTMLIGMIGLFHGGLFALLLVPLAIAGVLLLARRAVWWSEGRHCLAWTGSGLPFRVCTYLLLIMSIGSIIWIMLTYALMPPHDWDEVAYHLTVPKLYLQAHRIIYLPTIVGSNWPLGNEMLFSLSLMLGSDVAPHLLMLSMGLLTALGLLILARHNFDDRVGIIAVALLLTVPLFKRLAGTGLVDVAMGPYVLAALVALDRWEQERRWPWLALCGAYCGFAAGSKMSGLIIATSVGLLLLVNELRQHPLQISTVLGSGALFGLVVLLVAGPWYARSFIFTDNPVWPFAYPFFGGRDWDALGNKEYLEAVYSNFIGLDVARTPVGLFQSLVYLLKHPEMMGGYGGGIGVVNPLGALGVCALVIHAPRLLRQSLFVCVAFYLLWFACAPLELRYLLPIVPLLALATAYLFVWLYDRVRLRPLQLVLLVGLLLLVFHEWPWASADGRGLLASRIPYLRGQISRDEWLDTQIDSMPLFRYANTQLPTDVRILLLPYENRTYYLDRNYLCGNPVLQRLIPFEQFSSAAELATTLRQMNVTHVIDNPSWIYEGLSYWQQARALMLALRDECGRPLYWHGEGVLYALTECSTTAKPTQKP